ncbi:hypothetical protein DXG01_004765 [Tephrocybe rancida]|nr:hypothetical protein DXG01_004765 [Tephrocybe rancida]
MPIYFPDASGATQTNAASSLPTGSPSSDASDVDQAFAHFMSCLTSSDPGATSLQAFETPYDQFEMSNGSKDGSFNRTVSSSSEAPMPKHASETRVRPHSRRGGQPYNPGLRRRRLKEQPVYTRRQVDDMLNAVSNCFAGTMEEVLKRVDTTEKVPDNLSDNTRRKADRDVQLYGILNDALPRLMYGFQSLLGAKNSTSEWADDAI